MDEDLKDLEAELTRLQPAAAPARVERRIAAALVTPGRTQSLRLWRLAVAGLPIAAAIAGIVALRSHAPVQQAGSAGSAKADVLKPISAENVLYSATEEGVVTLADGTLARRERLQYVDTIHWQNPRTHASLTWSVPREEVRVVPIVYQ